MEEPINPYLAIALRIQQRAAASQPSDMTTYKTTLEECGLDLVDCPICHNTGRLFRYDEDGNISYVPIQRNLSPTGINIVDEYLRYMASGKMNVTDFTKPRGLLTEEIGIVRFVLTGIRGLRFRQLYQIKFVDELLRYTDLSFAEIAKRTGLGTPYYMYICLRREYDMSATERRKYLRQRGDLGRYVF